MRNKTRRQRIKSLLERVLTVAPVVGPVALLVVWLTFQHKPGWYRPANLDQAGIQRARSQAVLLADSISDQMVAQEPFDIVLQDRTMTEWLAALPTVWPEVRDAIPTQITDPAVWFDGGGVRVGAHYTGRAWQAILSVDIVLEVSEDGREVLIALRDVKGGSLSIPRALLTNRLDRLLREARAIGDRSDSGVETLLAAVRKIRSVDALFEGVRIKNRFVWFNGRRPFRIASIQIDAGALRLHIEPL